MADTNDNSAPDAELLLEKVGAPTQVGHCVSTKASPTCCNDHKGFKFKFDRVAANFGEYMNTTILYDPLPEWAGTQFHKAVATTWFLGESPPLFDKALYCEESDVTNMILACLAFVLVLCLILYMAGAVELCNSWLHRWRSRSSGAVDDEAD